jgi:hypothetical protein
VKHVFIQLSLTILFWQNETNDTLKIQICRNYCYQNVTQFSQWNNVLEAAVSTRDCVWEIYMCFFNSVE